MVWRVGARRRGLARRARQPPRAHGVAKRHARTYAASVWTPRVWPDAGLDEARFALALHARVLLGWPDGCTVGSRSGGLFMCPCWSGKVTCTQHGPDSPKSEVVAVAIAGARSPSASSVPAHARAPMPCVVFHASWWDLGFAEWHIKMQQMKQASTVPNLGTASIPKENNYKYISK